MAENKLMSEIKKLTNANVKYSESGRKNERLLCSSYVALPNRINNDMTKTKVAACCKIELFSLLRSLSISLKLSLL